jgi:hypothetical protein
MLPLERSATEFGLAVIPTGRESVASDAVAWTLYPNGVDPAPTASGQLCDEATVLSVRPATRDPRSRQQLHLSTVRDGVLTDRMTVLEAQHIREVSLASWSGGGLMALNADGRVLAVRVRCAPGPKTR